MRTTILSFLSNLPLPTTMVVTYSRLNSADTITQDFIKWIKTKVPVPFLRQQVLLVSIAVASIIFLISTSFFTSDMERDIIRSISGDINYGAIVDCGSSGSRAHIFRWRQNPETNHIELVRDHSKGLHITPGLSSFQHEPSKASDYLEPIMEFISEAIPRDKHLDSPVHFMATAGLRLLEPSIQKAILHDISRDLRVKFNFPKIKSQVISGEFEGIYSWISLNLNRANGKSENFRTYGMIEMGGASTQVAFELAPGVDYAILRNLKTNDAISAFNKERKTLDTKPGNPVKLFATTFLGLGVNSARDLAIDLLMKDYLKATGETQSLSLKDLESLRGYAPLLNDPCLTIGSKEIIMKPISLLRDSDQTIGFVIKEQNETFTVRVEGSGDFLSCMNLLERVIRLSKEEKLNCSPDKSPCSMDLLGTNFIPYDQYSFIGLSEMFFTTNEMMNSAGPFNRSQVLHETQRICGSRYNDLLEVYSKNGSSPPDRVLHECFKASWLLTILHDSGLRMPNDYENFKTLESMDGEEIDWTTGALVMEVALKQEIQ